MSDLLANLLLGFSVSLSWTNLALCLVGVLLGTLVGVLPGIGASTTIALLLPITFSLPPVGALIMLAGIYYGAQYGGSTTAILVKLPGESSSVIAVLDGHEMAKQGRAGPALAIAAIGSFFAGCVATVLIAALAPAIAELSLKFGPADYVALMFLGLVAAVVLSRGSFVNAIAMVAVGLLLGLVGTDMATGVPRLTLGIDELRDGIDFIPLAMGLFGISEILRNLGNQGEREVIDRKISGLMPTVADLKASAGAILRGTGVGAVLGILPGSGALLASFAAYTLEKKVSRTPEAFGRGAIQGLAAPESANNSAAQMSFVPMLTLGLPANAVMALMIGAMTIHGITPGPQILSQRPELFWGMIASMWVGNLMLLIINLPLVGIWVKLLKVPYARLFPAIILICCIGAFSIANSPFNVILLLVFGLVGYALLRLDCEPTPLLLAFILGPLVEQNLTRAMLLSQGSPLVFVERPASLVLLLIALCLMALMFVPRLRRRREVVFSEDAA